jgi:hypothetical protein
MHKQEKNGSQKKGRKGREKRKGVVSLMQPLHCVPLRSNDTNIPLSTKSIKAGMVLIGQKQAK